MKTVILAEKPNQARAYASAMQKSSEKQGYIEVQDSIFSGECVITYGFGHLVSLKQPQDYTEEWKLWNLTQLPMYPNPFEYTVTKDKQKQFNIVKKLLKEADVIIIATDIDREGEAIGRLIIQLAGCSKKNIKRLWINSLEKDVIRQGFQHLKDGAETYNYFIEAQTRGQADWLVGMNLSRLVTLLTRQAMPALKGTFSIGRVQTPTLYLIYQRNQAIKHFKPEPFKELEATIHHSNGTFKGKLKPNKQFFSDEEYLSFMTGINVNQKDAKISSVETKEKQTESPKLFSLSALQTKANSAFKASASQTLQAVQNLYEARLLTYPRTDCPYITDQEFSYLSQHLSDYCAWLKVTPPATPQGERKRYVNNKKVQEHHAIILTKQVPSESQWEKLEDLEKNIYQLVMKQTLAMFYPNYTYQETTILTQYQSHCFESKGKIPQQLGWKELYASCESEEDDKEKDNNQTLPPVAINDPCQVDLHTLDKETQPPKYYTEGSLITAMKTVGKTIDDADEKAILSEVEGIGTEATRAGIIETLKQRQYIHIEQNKVMVTPNGELICQMIEYIPLLKSAEMTAKWEKVLANIGKASSSQEAIQKQASFMANIHKFIDYEITELPNQLMNDTALTQQFQHTQSQMVEKQVIGKCPKCGQQIMDRGKFYSCENYKECHCPSVPKKYAGATIPKKVVLSLMSGQKTDPLSFKSKAGKKFKAQLTYNISENKIEMIFD